MENQKQMIAIALLVLAIIIVIFLLIRNIRKTSIKKELDEINVRFNKIKTVPLAQRLTRAKAMAQIDDSVESVEEYFTKYNDAQKHLDQLQELINSAEDSLATRKFSEAQRDLTVIKENLKDSEEEVNEIEVFLNRFVEKENQQREYINELKENFRDLKLKMNDNVSELSYSLEGLNERCLHCEELFSQAEDWMYANEFASAQENLDQITTEIEKLNKAVDELPTLIKEAKGTIPVLVDEVERQSALSSQRGLYLDHLHIAAELDEIDKELKQDIAIIADGSSENVGESLDKIKTTLNGIITSLNNENKAFSQLKKASDSLHKEIDDYAKNQNYLQVMFESEKERYSLADLESVLPQQLANVERYQGRVAEVDKNIESNEMAATAIIEDASSLFNSIRKDKEAVNQLKAKVDNTSAAEAHAKSLFVRFQIILNEAEVNISQYRLQSISSSYNKDLQKGYQYVDEVNTLLNEIPLNVDKLNSTLEEAMDFIYELYNNVNNVVSMSIMVEKAIVFGNKYRSSYPEVDRELSRAELCYMNGEYVEALKVALSSMNKLYPGGVDNKILEKAK